MPISGPNLQLPDANAPLTEEKGNVRFEWQQMFNALYQVAYNSTRSGPTASRPTDKLPGRWIGMPYYDTDLGFQINLDSTNPDVWHDGQGNVV
jgi:hypothetical protein